MSGYVYRGSEGRMYPLPVQQDSWGNCYDLPGFVYEKYYTADVKRQPELSKVAKAICARCVILEECRAEALKHRQKGQTGIIAGVPRRQIDTARHWLAYEVGASDHVPSDPRPEWLECSEAAEMAEQTRVELEDAS